MWQEVKHVNPLMNWLKKQYEKNQFFERVFKHVNPVRYKIKKWHEKSPWFEPLFPVIMTIVVALASSLTISISLVFLTIIYFAIFSSYATKNVVTKNWAKKYELEEFMKLNDVIARFEDSIKVTRTPIDKSTVMEATP
jgi:ABC-type multidrug transport system fused ATPase/permease subunit